MFWGISFLGHYGSFWVLMVTIVLDPFHQFHTSVKLPINLGIYNRGQNSLGQMSFELKEAFPVCKLNIAMGGGGITT